MSIMDSINRHGVMTGNLDTTVNPAEDFYLYANGGWMQKNPLRPEYSRFGMFDLLRDNNRERLRDLITNLAQSPEAKEKGSVAQKIGDLYSMGMDMERRDREGASPILPYIKKINETEAQNLTELFAFLHNGLSSLFYSIGVGPDPADSNIHILHIGETGLGLGDRDYYLEKNENNEKILRAYEKYVKRIMELAGYDTESSQRVWETLIDIEKQFAAHKKTREEMRNPLLRHNPMKTDDFLKKYNNIDWESMFKSLGIEKPESLNVSSVKFIEFINDFLPSLSLQQIKDYCACCLVSASTQVLSSDFENADFEMYGRVMSGQKEMKPLWKRAMVIPDSMFGEAVGELYVKKYFPEENKTYMLGLVENLRKALGKHIENLSWMSDETKKKALDKLSSISVKIGYPDKWKDYSEITIDPELSYQENVYRASKWFVKDSLSKLGKEVDKEEWLMTPQTVNAYYMPLNNEICFPAAILQPPYFDFNADDALNYGAIGVVIGHEMTHGFDDQGRRFSKDGNLENWWLPEDEERFNRLADALTAQFDKVEVAPGVMANGKFTLGENIADQGGLRIALTAYLDSIDPKDMVEIDGFSPLQRFYLSYANVWASNIRDEEVLLRTKTDSHSLEKNRVNETLKNITPFLEAFNIKPGDKMYRAPEERVIIW